MSKKQTQHDLQHARHVLLIYPKIAKQFEGELGFSFVLMVKQN